jgi:hypothetical protein
MHSIRLVVEANVASTGMIFELSEASASVKLNASRPQQAGATGSLYAYAAIDTKLRLHRHNRRSGAGAYRIMHRQGLPHAGLGCKTGRDTRTKIPCWRRCSPSIYESAGGFGHTKHLAACDGLVLNDPPEQGEPKGREIA